MTLRLGLIVDGQGDFAAFNVRFKGKCRVVKTDGPRGHHVTAKQLIAYSRKQIALLTTLGCEKILILTDLEGRATPQREFVRDLNRHVSELHLGVPLGIAVPDIMIENWYLADVEVLSKSKKYLKDKVKQKRYEGTNGKAELKKLFQPGCSYNETKHGPELFKIIRFDVAKKNSPSFGGFLELINSYI